ncbi:MAG: amino acid ABC transporter substrate-binding protein [Candidatus Verstraetearchaeota archaeon]|jgi:branched-chain amino acid transport system substrate-binding protein|nr:amino acid ABC transporter substrate-binding protein [Candidatus Verstraetearchaeota archaeon]
MYTSRGNMGISRLAAIIILAVVIVAAGAGLYYYFFYLPATKPRIAGVIKIGCTSSLTGKLAVEGTRQINGLILWVEWVNSRGGIKVGDKYYNVTLVYYDDQSSKDLVITLYEKLVTEDKVDFLISPYSSGLAFTASAIAEKYRKVMVVTGAASDSIFQQGYKYIVQTYTPGSLYLRSSIDLVLKKDPKAKKVAIPYEDELFSATAALGAKKYAEEKGLEVVYFDKYPSGATDLSPLLTKIKALGPDIIVGGGHFADGVLLAKQLKELGINVKLVSILVAPPEDKFYEALKETANYIMGPSQWEPDVKYSVNYGPTVEEFIKMYEARWKERPTYHSAGGFVAGLYLQAALEKAGTLESSKVREAFNTLELKTFYGFLKIDPATGLQIGHEMVLVQWIDGKKYTVWPPEAATREPVYPKPPW